MPPQTPVKPKPGQDVTALMSGQDVTDLMNQSTTPPPQVDKTAENLRSSFPVLSMANDLTIGAGKSALDTLVGLGDLVHKIPGFRAFVDKVYGTPGLSESAFQQAHEAAKPSNITQGVGNIAGKTAQFVATGGQSGVVNAATQGGLTLAQGGTPIDAGLSAAAGYFMPGAAAMRQGAGMLEDSAVSSEARSLGATRKMADQAKFVGEEMLKRGLGGTRYAMKQNATAAVEDVGKAISKEVDRATNHGDVVDNKSIVQGIRDAAGKHISAQTGQVQPGYEGVVAEMENVAKFLESHGDTLTVAQAQQFKTEWSQIVAKAGLFGDKAGQPAADAAKAWAYKAASDGLRKALSSNLTLDGLNKEYEFQISLKNVLEETAKRELGKGARLAQMTGGGLGAAAGATFGTAGLGLGAILGAAGVKLIQSPIFQNSVSAPLKSALADALASGNGQTVSAVLKSIMASLPAQVSAQFTQTTGTGQGAANTSSVGSGRMGGPGR